MKVLLLFGATAVMLLVLVPRWVRPWLYLRLMVFLALIAFWGVTR
jgi:hypothetical protein